MTPYGDKDRVQYCCLTAPSHYMNQYWLIISKVQQTCFNVWWLRHLDSHVQKLLGSYRNKVGFWPDVADIKHDYTRVLPVLLIYWTRRPVNTWEIQALLVLKMCYRTWFWSQIKGTSNSLKFHKWPPYSCKNNFWSGRDIEISLLRQSCAIPRGTFYAADRLSGSTTDKSYGHFCVCGHLNMNKEATVRSVSLWRHRWHQQYNGFFIG